MSGPVIASSGAIRKTKMPPAQKKTWIALSAGGVGGAIECCCTWPMEYLKTQLQSFRTVKGGPPPPFTGIASGLRYTIQQKGFFSLYTGLTPVLIFSAPKAGVRFGANQFFRNQLADKNTGKVSMGLSFLAGLCAGICEATLVVTPQETIKTKLINLNMGLRQGIPHLLKTEGVAGLYAGLGATCLKQGGNQGSRFLFMAQWRQFLTGEADAMTVDTAGSLGKAAGESVRQTLPKVRAKAAPFVTKVLRETERTVEDALKENAETAEYSEPVVAAAARATKSGVRYARGALKAADVARKVGRVYKSVRGTSKGREREEKRDSSDKE